ncbi:MAG: tetratricopeptide repeat protein [Sphingomicrobium sp.]
MLILFFAASVAAAAPDSCPSDDTAAAHICLALEASKAGDNAAGAAEFEKAGTSSGEAPARARALAAAGNLWIAAGEPGKAALALDRALAGTGLQAEQRGEALLDRARAAEAQNDLKTARAKADQAAAIIAEDPFLWYFSAALAIREGDKETAQSAINKALNLAPGDSTVLFEAGHVAQFAGDNAKARDYWNRAIQGDATGPVGKAAREAIAMLPAPTPSTGAPTGR